VGGLPAIKARLPQDWFALYDYGAGLIVQAGPTPEAAPVNQPKPARLVLPNHLFKPLRAPKVGLHSGSVNGEPRLNGEEGLQWLKRLDIGEEELTTYQTQLRDEPKLTADTTLSQGRIAP
jgi:hypothetical protein